MEATPAAKRYHRQKILLRISSFVLEFLFLFALVLTPLSRGMVNIAESFTALFAFQILIYMILFLLLSELLTLPIAWASGFYLERRYGLSNQTSASWAKDHIKAFLLNAVLTILFVEIFYAFLSVGGRWWWAWVALVFSLLLIVLARLAPVLIFPLFFKFKPLANAQLLERIQTLADRSGTKIKGIFEMNLSRKSNTVNAALAGMGRSRRIILADTLLARFPDDEIEVVVAHEIGHHLHNHLLKGMIVQTATIWIFMWLVDLLAGRMARGLGYDGLLDLGALPLLALVAAAMGTLVMPFMNALLRHFERQADSEAIRLTGLPAAFSSTMRRLADLNMADPSPHPWIERLFYSHPSIQRRLEFGRKFEEHAGNQ